MKYFTIKKVASENPQGFTFDIRCMRMVRSGKVAAYKATQDSIGNEGLTRVLVHAMLHDGIVGGWLNAQGEMQYDSCRLFTDLDECLQFGREQEQLAIYDLDTETQYDL
jgi:fructokinase